MHRAVLKRYQKQLQKLVFEAATKNINFEVRSLDSRVLLVKKWDIVFSFTSVSKKFVKRARMMHIMSQNTFASSFVQQKFLRVSGKCLKKTDYENNIITWPVDKKVCSEFLKSQSHDEEHQTF